MNYNNITCKGDIKEYLKHLNKKFINNIRISEYEELCSYWKNINLYEYKDLIIKMIKIYFGNLFEIKKIFFENIGIYIFKVHMKAIKYSDQKFKNCSCKACKQRLSNILSRERKKK